MPDPTSSRTSQAAIIINPTKAPGADFRTVVVQQCHAAGWAEPLWLETSKDDPGTGTAQEALESGVDLVIVAGGDGTARCVATSLAGTDTPMGLIPLGTGNLLARNLGLDITDPAAALRGALDGTNRPIDVVRVVLDESDRDEVFLVMAGLGFDAAVMADASTVLKDKVGWLAYVDAGIRNLPGKPVRSEISVDGARPLVRRMRSIMGGNCGKIQGGLEIFPGASVSDGVVDILLVAPAGAMGWLGVLIGLLRRGHDKDPALEYLRGKSVVVRTARPQEIELDGTI